jgi:glucokinase
MSEQFNTGYLAIDFGGTRIRAAWFSPDLRMVARHEALTNAAEGPIRVVKRVIQSGQQAVPSGATILAIGIAAPGPLSPLTGVIYHADTLPGWENVPLGPLVSAAFKGVPVFVHNDANLAALAEHQQGAGRKFGLFADPMLYLTISTGIGGGVIIGGQLFSGWSGLAAEPGHMPFRMADGSVKKWEQLASGTALGLAAQERLATWEGDTVLRQATPLDGQAVGTAALKGDPLALAVVEGAAEWLGLGLVSLIHLFSPEKIVLGGSVTQLGDLLLAPAKRVIEAHILDPLFLPRDLIRLATLGDDAGLIGAALYAHQRHTAIAP